NEATRNKRLTEAAENYKKLFGTVDGTRAQIVDQPFSALQQSLQQKPDFQECEILVSADGILFKDQQVFHKEGSYISKGAISDSYGWVDVARVRNKLNGSSLERVLSNLSELTKIPVHYYQDDRLQPLYGYLKRLEEYPDWSVLANTDSIKNELSSTETDQLSS